MSKKVAYVIVQHGGEYEEKYSYINDEAYAKKPDALQRVAELEKTKEDGEYFTVKQIIIHE